MKNSASVKLANSPTKEVLISRVANTEADIPEPVMDFYKTEEDR